jgi:hypothetical protein
MPRVATNAIRLSASVEDAQDKLQQQIDEGEVIRSRGGVISWMNVEELKAERRLWAEYTSEVLKASFGADDYARDFDSEATPFPRSGGNIQEFAFDERSAILAGVTFLRSLHKRLPLIAVRSQQLSLQSRAIRRTKKDEPQAEAVAELLAGVHPELSNSYKQILRDLQDVTRLSYRGTANEMREILREVLVRLAPDAQVASQAWFAQAQAANGETRRPTQQQRARYILEKKGCGTKVHDVAEGSLQTVDEALSRLVRDMYSRTSVAAHTAQDLQEIKRQVMYFDALIHDLCG